MGELPAIGSVVADKYRIEALLGEGGMGAVVEVHDVGLHQGALFMVMELLEGEKVQPAPGREASVVDQRVGLRPSPPNRTPASD